GGVGLEALHRVELPQGQRNEDEPGEDRERHDRPAPGEAGRPVRAEPVEDGAKRVLERREDPGDDHAKSLWSWAWSTPPRLQGLQRSSRQPASTLPRRRPY